MKEIEFSIKRQRDGSATVMLNDNAVINFDDEGQLTAYDRACLYLLEVARDCAYAASGYRRRPRGDEAIQLMLVNEWHIYVHNSWPWRTNENSYVFMSQAKSGRKYVVYSHEGEWHVCIEEADGTMGSNIFTRRDMMQVLLQADTYVVDDNNGDDTLWTM